METNGKKRENGVCSRPEHSWILLAGRSSIKKGLASGAAEIEKLRIIKLIDSERRRRGLRRR